MSELVLSVLLEVTVLIVIVFEIVALYRNMRIEQRLDQHLRKTDAMITELDKHLDARAFRTHGRCARTVSRL